MHSKSFDGAMFRMIDETGQQSKYGLPVNFALGTYVINVCCDMDRFLL